MVDDPLLNEPAVQAGGGDEAGIYQGYTAELWATRWRILKGMYDALVEQQAGGGLRAALVEWCDRKFEEGTRLMDGQTVETDEGMLWQAALKRSAVGAAYVALATDLRALVATPQGEKGRGND